MEGLAEGEDGMLLLLGVADPWEGEIKIRVESG